MLIPAFLLAAFLIVIDQITKYLAVKYIMPIHSLSIINISNLEILNFTYIENTGAAFSILEGQKFFLILVPIFFVLVLFYLLLTKRIENKLMIWASALIIAGGLGNLIDRLFNGYVVDFIDLRFIKFAIFNIADICAVVGAIIFLVAVFIEDKKAKN